MLVEMLVAPFLLCVAVTFSQIATSARIAVGVGARPKGDPGSCPAFSATFAVAGAVTAGSRRQLKGGMWVLLRPMTGWTPT